MRTHFDKHSRATMKVRLNRPLAKGEKLFVDSCELNYRNGKSMQVDFYGGYWKATDKKNPCIVTFFMTDLDTESANDGYLDFEDIANIRSLGDVVVNIPNRDIRIMSIVDLCFADFVPEEHCNFYEVDERYFKTANIVVTRDP